LKRKKSPTNLPKQNACRKRNEKCIVNGHVVQVYHDLAEVTTSSYCPWNKGAFESTDLSAINHLFTTLQIT